MGFAQSTEPTVPSAKPGTPATDSCQQREDSWGCEVVSARLQAVQDEPRGGKRKGRSRMTAPGVLGSPWHATGLEGGDSNRLLAEHPRQF